MKTCRFCMFQQENGDFCEACGSPFSADKVDFSEGMPDLMQGPESFPDPTVPLAGASVAPSGPSTPAEPSAPEVPVTPAPSGEKEKPVSEPPKKISVPEERKVMYSARAAGETVYTKNRGKLRPTRNDSTPFIPSLSTSEDAPDEQPGPGWWNGAPNSGTASAQGAPVPIIAAPSSSQQSRIEAFKPYQGVYLHTKITLILSLAGLICLCGMSFISLIFSSVAFSSMWNMKNGAVGADAGKTARRCNIFAIIADIGLVLGMIAMICMLVMN